MKYGFGKRVLLTLMPRPDGGLRVFSPDVPGLVLSGPDQAKVMSDVLPALDALEEHKNGEAA